MNVRIDRACGHDQPLPGDHFAAGAERNVDARLDVGIARLADRSDAPVLDADIRLDDTPVIENHGVGDDRVDHLCRDALSLAHAVADDLAAAELDLLTVDRVIALDFDPQLGVAQTHPITGGRAVHLRIGAPVDARHDSGPMILPWKP